jgi:hypothetical protein
MGKRLSKIYFISIPGFWAALDRLSDRSARTIVAKEKATLQHRELLSLANLASE